MTYDSPTAYSWPPKTRVAERFADIPSFADIKESIAIGVDKLIQLEDHLIRLEAMSMDGPTARPTLHTGVDGTSIWIELTRSDMVLAKRRELEMAREEVGKASGDLLNRFDSLMARELPSLPAPDVPAPPTLASQNPLPERRAGIDLDELEMQIRAVDSTKRMDELRRAVHNTKPVRQRDLVDVEEIQKSTKRPKLPTSLFGRLKGAALGSQSGSAA